MFSSESLDLFIERSSHLSSRINLALNFVSALDGNLNDSRCVGAHSY